MANRNRSAGHNYERKVVAELKELGFGDAVTARSESRNMDAKKVDIMGKTLIHPIQTKVYQSTFNYHKFFKDPDLYNEKEVVIIHNKVEKSKGGRFMGKGEYALMRKQAYYDLLKYKLAFDEMMTYYDSLGEEQKMDIHKFLTKLGL